MKSDLEELQGSWSVTSVRSDGVNMSQALLREARIVVKGKTFTSLGMGAPYKGNLLLAPDQKPKQIDLVFTAGHAKGVRQLGIYKIDSDKWSICFAAPGEERPKRFTSVSGSGVVLETLSRSESVEPAKGQAPTKKLKQKRSTTASERTELEGEWQMTSAVFNGQPMDESMVKWCKRITRGNATKVVAGPQVFLNVNFTLREGEPFNTIDYVNLDASGKEQFGIYELMGDKLRICVGGPGKPRPNEFNSKTGDGRSFTVWKRLKN